MDKEEIESMMQKILRQIHEFTDEPDYEKAVQLDSDISILRFLIGEQNFLPLHYFRQAHEKVVMFIDEHDKKGLVVGQQTK